MLILGMDTTGNTLSVGLAKDGKPVGEIFINDTKKHSETLLPAVNSLLEISSYDISDIDIFAVSIGPGSFTGIRIGAGCAAGFAQACGKKIAQVDTLKALCENIGKEGVVCAVMDARRNEVYASAYKDGNMIVEPCALPIDELLLMLKEEEEVTFVGDGADAYKDIIMSSCVKAKIAPVNKRYQRGLSVCNVALEMAEKGELSEYEDIQPVYLRVSQAERMRKEKGN